MTRSITSALFTTALVASLTAGCATDDTNERILTRDDTGTMERNDAGGMEETDASDDGTSDAGDTTDHGMDTGAPDMNEPTDMARDDSGVNNGDGVCSPVRDGVVTRGEVPLEVGLSADFKVALDAPVNTAGTMQNGIQTWDLSGDLPGDEIESVEIEPVENRWFADDFPDATHAVDLSAENDLIGVYQTTDDALYLLGVVSPDDGLYRTELEYDPPVPVLAFPFEVGDTWSITSDVSGRASGVVAVYDETYTYEIDAEGELITPVGQFPVFRVSIVLERDLTYYTETIRTYAFVSECFGTIAQIRSKTDEEGDEFTEAAEVRRITQ